jgi:hypothetical protein
MKYTHCVPSFALQLLVCSAARCSFALQLLRPPCKDTCKVARVVINRIGSLCLVSSGETVLSPSPNTLIVSDFSQPILSQR